MARRWLLSSPCLGDWSGSKRTLAQQRHDEIAQALFERDLWLPAEGVASVADVRQQAVAIDGANPRGVRLDRDRATKDALEHRDDIGDRMCDARPEIVVDSLAWHPVGASTPLIIDLGAYFDRVLDA